MANPTVPLLSQAAAEALSGTIDPFTGIKHQALGAGPSSTPSAASRLMNLEASLFQLIAQSINGLVLDLADGLKVGVYACRYRLGGTTYVFNGSASTTLGASVTTVLYLDSDQVLKTSTTGYPAGAIWRLATVVTDATDVTSVTDDRGENLDPAALTNWWTYLPTAAIDFNVQKLGNLGGIGLGASTILTLDAGGAVTLAGSKAAVQLDTFGAAGTQDLTSLGSGTTAGDMYLLHAKTTLHVVTIKSTALTTPHGDYVLDALGKYLLVRWNGSVWEEVFRSNVTSYAGLNFTNIGKWNLNDTVTATIATGAITVTANQSQLDVRTEAAAATDDLDTISGGARGDLLVLMSGFTGRTVVVKHATGNIYLANNKDFTLSSIRYRLLLQCDGVGNWVEIARSRYIAADLADTGKAIPYPIAFDLAGALTTGVKKISRYIPYDIVIVNVTGIVGTAPSGGACIVDLLDDGASIFASQAEMVNIADAATSDTSATKNSAVAAGSILTIEVEAANSAADLSLIPNAFIDPKTPPA